MDMDEASNYLSADNRPDCHLIRLSSTNPQKAPFTVSFLSARNYALHMRVHRHEKGFKIQNTEVPSLEAYVQQTDRIMCNRHKTFPRV
jgi:hypothetical protein